MRLALIAALSLLIAPSVARAEPMYAGPDKAAAPASASPPVLVIIDVQNFYFPGGALPLTGPVEASVKAKEVLEAFRARGWPVIHVLHLADKQATPAPSSGDRDYQAHPNVMPRAGERVIGKRFANSFRETELLDELRRLRAKQLVILGMQTHMCVEAATRAAADLGFEVTVVHDACATRPLSFGGQEVPAAQVHTGVLAALKGNYAKVVSTSELLDAFNAQAQTAK